MFFLWVLLKLLIEMKEFCIFGERNKNEVRLNLVNQSVEFAKKKVGFPMLSQILKELVSWGGGGQWWWCHMYMLFLNGSFTFSYQIHGVYHNKWRKHNKFITKTGKNHFKWNHYQAKWISKSTVFFSLFFFFFQNLLSG